MRGQSAQGPQISIANSDAATVATAAAAAATAIAIEQMFGHITNIANYWLWAAACGSF